MAMHHILLQEPIEGAVGMSSHLRFDGSTVTVEWKYGQTVSMPAAVGDVVFVDCWGGLPRIGKTVPPKRLDRLALWLVGVPRDGRFPDRESAEKNFKKTKHETTVWWENTVYRFNPDATPPGFRVISGERWFVGERTNYESDGTRWLPFCGWVSHEINPGEVREFVDLLGSRWRREVTEKFLPQG